MTDEECHVQLKSIRNIVIKAGAEYKAGNSALINNIQREINKVDLFVGVDDRDIDLFESQYIVPNGVLFVM